MVVVAANVTVADPVANYVHKGKVLLPDPDKTPGDVMQTSVAKICRHGYAATVRAVEDRTKQEVYDDYGASKAPNVCCEVDHLISLELGGSNEKANLWPQPYEPIPGAHNKDVLENYLHHEVCAGRMTLAAAQEAIKTDWLAAYKKMPKKGKALTDAIKRR